MRQTPDEYRKFIASCSDKDLQYLLECIERDAERRKPKLLAVSDEEQQKIKEIFDVFQGYIDGHYFFDIFYSKKYGYYRLDIDGEHDQFNTADDIIHCLIFEFSNDVRALKIGAPHMTTSMYPGEAAELKKRITPYIEKLSNSEHYFEILNTFIDRFTEE